MKQSITRLDIFKYRWGGRLPLLYPERICHGCWIFQKRCQWVFKASLICERVLHEEDGETTPNLLHCPFILPVLAFTYVSRLERRLLGDSVRTFKLGLYYGL